MATPTPPTQAVPRRGLWRAFLTHPMTVTSGLALYLLLVHVFFVVYMEGALLLTTAPFMAEALLTFTLALAAGALWARKDRELGRTTAYFRHILQGIPDPVAIVDGVGRVADSNPALQRWFGDPHRTLGEPVAEAFRLDARNEGPFILAIDAARDGRRCGPLEVDVETDEGAKHVVVEAMRLDPHDPASSVIVLLKDVTPVIEVREQVRRLGVAVQAMDEALFILDREGRIEAANPLALKLLQREMPALRGRPMAEMVRDPGVDFLRAVDPVTGKAKWEGERDLVRPDDTTVPASIKIIPVHGPAWSPETFLVIARDLTDTRQRDAELRQQQAMLIEAEKLASIGSLVAGVAHEINNPLGSMRANTELALMNIDALRPFIADDPRAHEAVDEIRDFIEANLRGIDRIHATTKALKEVSRRRPGETDLLDINQAVHEVAQVLRPVLSSQADIDYDLARDVLPILCAPHEVHQVILNLFKNAAEAIAHTGARGRIRVTTRQEGDRVSLSIEDSGPGVPLELRRRVFDPFFTTKEKGTGLGLSISVNVARNHGGALFLEEGSLGGARFVLKLPLRPPRWSGTDAASLARRAPSPPAYGGDTGSEAHA